MPSFETLDGRAVSWSEFKLTANVNGGIALPVVDIKSINYSSKVDVGEQRGASGGRVRKRTSGTLSNEGAATFYREGLDALKEAIASVAAAAGHVNSDGNVQLSKVTFNLVITHDWVDDPRIYIRELNGCRLLGDSGKHEEGTDPETVDVDIKPLSIVSVLNGVRTVLL
jgi:hypothetical protein